MQSVSILGTGHMGSSIAIALSQSKDIRLLLHNRTPSKAEKLAAKIDATSVSLDEAIEADYVLLGVPPKEIKPLLLSFTKRPKGCVVSMAAGVSLESLHGLLGDIPLYRIMPNTPVLLGKGFVPYCAFDPDEGSRRSFESLFSPLGRVKEIDEGKMDAYSVLSGSSPAFLDYCLDALVEAGKEIGLSEDEAKEAILFTAEGSVALAKGSSSSLRELGEAVCSKGGSTIEGVDALLHRGLYEAFLEAVKASYAKNKAMLKEE